MPPNQGTRLVSGIGSTKDKPAENTHPVPWLANCRRNCLKENKSNNFFFVVKYHLTERKLSSYSDNSGKAERARDKHLCEQEFKGKGDTSPVQNRHKVIELLEYQKMESGLGFKHIF